MKTRMLPMAFALLGFALAATAGAADAALKTMAFNIRYGKAPDGENAWPKRQELLFETIARYDPDLIGFQEVLADQRDALEARMPGHAFAGVAREDGKRQGEFACLAYRRDRFDLLATGDFWLSETPAVAGSKSWDSSLPRICTWVRLRDRKTGRELLFANTHFDHRGVQARLESARLLATKLPQLAAGAPAILTGDLNLNEDSPAYAVLTRPERPRALRWIDAYRTVHPRRSPEEASFGGFKGTTKGSRIDFVFHTEHFRATAAEIDRFSREGRYPSDHYPVTAVLVPAGK
jgi:endonuclease/exonuclease/phosphatase family metal-dependent hydrolase